MRSLQQTNAGEKAPALAHQRQPGRHSGPLLLARLPLGHHRRLKQHAEQHRGDPQA